MKRILLSFTLVALLSNVVLLILDSGAFSSDIQEGIARSLHVDTCYLLKVLLVLKLLFSFLLES